MAPITVRNYSNTTPPTNLTANIDNALTTTNIPVASTAGYPVVPFTGCFERNTNNQEFVLCTNIVDANHFSVVRAYDGTPAVQHLAPATFEHCTGAIDFREANQHHTDTTRDDHLQYVLANGSRAITGLQTFSSGLSAQTVAISGFPSYSYMPTRYVGGTAGPGPPGGGTFQVGDWVLDTVNCRWMCITAGTPGVWTPEPGHVYARVYGPPAGQDIINRQVQVLSYSFTAVKGMTYEVDVRFQGLIITAIPAWVNSVLTCTGGMLPSTVYVMTIGGAAFVTGNVVSGSCTVSLTPVTVTGTQTLRLYATSAGRGAMRMTGYNAELIMRKG
jgi:hypothetical protein